MKQTLWNGMGVALITPFKDDGSVDYDALQDLVEYHLQNGTDFLCVLGTTAETPTLTKEEKTNIINLVTRTVNQRIPILLGVGSNCTHSVVQTLHETPMEGIDAVLVVVPYYNKPSQEGMYQHFMAVAEASPVPVVLYNVPGRTGVNMTAQTTLRLANDSKRIVAIKEASGNLEQIGEILRHKPEGFNVLCGDDGLTTELIGMGATGVISVFGNAYPKSFTELVRLARQGQMQQAEELNARFVEMYRLLFVDGNPAGIKALLHLMGKVQNVLRLPLVRASSETVETMRNLMSAFPEV